MVLYSGGGKRLAKRQHGKRLLRRRRLWPVSVLLLLVCGGLAAVLLHGRGGPLVPPAERIRTRPLSRTGRRGRSS